jgi:hypothetical protein
MGINYDACLIFGWKVNNDEILAYAQKHNTDVCD